MGRWQPPEMSQDGLSIREIEYVLMHAETLVTSDLKSSQSEERFLAIGRNANGRYSFVVFTPRRRGSALRLRPISARYMHQREIRKYEQEIARAQKR